MDAAGDFDPRQYGARLLVGERVRLRGLADRDLADLTRWWSDPAWAVFQARSVTPRSDQSVVEMFRAWSAGDKSGEAGFSVLDRESDQLVGHATLFGARLPERAAMLAIMIGGEFVDQGYGSDAVRVLTRYGFAEIGLNRIEIQVHAFNGRARAAYRKAGYVEEGVRREATFHDGAFHDEVIMSALARDW